MTLDPVATNPDHYSVIFENEHVRVSWSTSTTPETAQLPTSTRTASWSP
jgi:hypothetical protein